LGQTVTFATDNGDVEGYLAIPQKGSGPGLIVIQEWWGLVPHIRDLADRFADAGFVALAPDLYHGDSTTEPDEAGRMMQELKVTDAARDLGGAIDFLLARDEVTGGKVGVTGFCMGGALALVTANTAPTRIGASVPFYGVFWYGEPDLSNVSCPVLMHIGTDDDFIPVSKVEELAELVRANGAAVDVETYEGAGHAFVNDTRPEAHHPEAAAEAWRRTVDFLHEHLA